MKQPFMKKKQKEICMRSKKTIIFLVAALFMTLTSCNTGLVESDVGNSSVEDSSSLGMEVDDSLVAHWKFQNEESYYKGNIDTDELTFFDLSGHGNDLVVASEGNGAQLDVFSWDEGSYYGGESSLKFNNTLEQAKSVDPYEATQTSFSGAYVSGKYLQTVEDAPMNSFTGENGWTIEIIFKVSPEWNNMYNRYVGLFSRQGVQEQRNEPPLSMALTSTSDGRMGALGADGSIGLQYVHIGADERITNVEYCNGEINADEWVHFMIVNEGNTAGRRTLFYMDGVYIDKFTDTSSFSASAVRGWEVGVGRKLAKGEATMNIEHPEGLIRRLFCGSISEIRFSVGTKPIFECLIADYI